jgi:hypothetical protein
MQENSIEEIIQLIANAFDDADFPSENAVFIPSAGHIFDIDQATTELGKKHWRDISVNTLQRNKDRISYLTPQAFHFYFPAFLTGIIKTPHAVDVLRENIIASLTPSKNEFTQPIFESRARTFNTRQVEAILSFFENYTAIYPPDKWSFSIDDQIQVQTAIDFWKDALINRTDNYV